MAGELVRENDVKLSDSGDLSVLTSLPEKLMSRPRLLLLETDEVRDAPFHARTGRFRCSKIFARLLAKDEIRSPTIEDFAVTVGAVDFDI